MCKEQPNFIRACESADSNKRGHIVFCVRICCWISNKSPLPHTYLRDKCLRAFIVIVVLIVLVCRRRCRCQVLPGGGSGDGLVVLMANLVEELGDDGHCKKKTREIATRCLYRNNCLQWIPLSGMGKYCNCNQRDIRLEDFHFLSQSTYGTPCGSN